MSGARFSLLFLLLLVLFAAPGHATAQGPGVPTPLTAEEVTGPPAALGQPAQVPMSPGAALPERVAPARTLRAYWHVFIAFAVTWALLFGYALSIGWRLGGVERELRTLQRGAPPA